MKYVEKRRKEEEAKCVNVWLEMERVLTQGRENPAVMERWWWMRATELVRRGTEASLLLIRVVQLLSCVQLFVTPWTSARQVSLSQISQDIPEFAQVHVH